MQIYASAYILALVIVLIASFYYYFMMQAIYQNIVMYAILVSLQNL